MNLEITSLRLSVNGIMEFLKNYNTILDCSNCDSCPLNKEIEISNGYGKTISKPMCWVLENIQEELNKME